MPLLLAEETIGAERQIGLKKSPPQVFCRHCGVRHLLTTAFDSAYAAWPESGMLAFRCPLCDAENRLALDDEQVAEGDWIAGDPPLLLAERVTRVPGLVVLRHAWSLTLNLGNQAWVVAGE